MNKTKMSPEFEAALIKNLRKTQRKILVLGLFAILATVTIVAGVGGGLIYLFKLIAGN